MAHARQQARLNPADAAVLCGHRYRWKGAGEKSQSLAGGLIEHATAAELNTLLPSRALATARAMPVSGGRRR
jgi:hypothetical protein